MEPPAGVADLSTDVSRVWGAETVLVVIPAEGVLHRPTKARHVQAVLILLTVDPVGEGQNHELRLLLGFCLLISESFRTTLQKHKYMCTFLTNLSIYNSNS